MNFFRLAVAIPALLLALFATQAQAQSTYQEQWSDLHEMRTIELPVFKSAAENEESNVYDHYIEAQNHISQMEDGPDKNLAMHHFSFGQQYWTSGHDYFFLQGAHEEGAGNSYFNTFVTEGPNGSWQQPGTNAMNSYNASKAGYIEARWFYFEAKKSFLKVLNL